MRVYVVAALCLLGCGEPVTGDEANILSPSEVPDVIQRANNGDLAAASTLSTYYGAIGDPEESRRWLQFAAQRGDCNAINVLHDDITGQESSDETLVAELRLWADEHGCILNEDD